MGAQVNQLSRPPEFRGWWVSDDPGEISKTKKHKHKARHNEANSGCRTSPVVWQMVMLEGVDGMISGTIEEYDFGKRWPQLRTYTNRQTRETLSRKM